MSAHIPSQFELENPEGAPAGANPSAAAGTTGAGYGYGYGHSMAGDDSEWNLVHYLQILYRRRYIAATAFIVVVLSVVLYTVTTTRIYQATTRILIERENPNVVAFKEVLEPGTLTDDYYETQYAILQGRGLARRTIESLDLWSHPQFNQVPQWTLRGMILTPVNVVTRWFEPPRPIEPPGAEETRVQSRVIDQFLGNLGVEAVRYSRLVDVTFRSPDAALAAKAANALADAYITQSVELRSTTTKEASDFLTQQLAEQRLKLEASEQALQAYRERTDSVSLEERQNVVVQRLADLNAAVTKASTTRIQKEAAYNQVKIVQENPAAIDSVPLILSNPFVQQQKTELAQLQRQRAQLSEKLGPNHPDMVKIGLAIQNGEARIQSEVAQIVQGMRSDYDAARAEERTLTAALNQQKQEAQVLNRAGIQYGVLQRDATASRQMFESLLQRTQETGVSQELKAGNIRVVDPAETPTGPVSPNAFHNLLLALFGGLTLAVGLTFVFEYADDRIKNPDELKKHLGLPFLGMVPALFEKKDTAPLISNGPSGLFSESFRSIRTNVLFSSADEGGRLIVVTSSAPGEGKTVVSTNLSVALAQAGNRVLLIDGDMRKPRVHQVFSFAVEPGLSNVLVGNAAAADATLQSSTPGLWVMPAGTSPPNPAELLGSKRFKDFTSSLLQHFDWVIVDTPPVMAVTDASIAANLSHGVLFVVGAEMTSRRVAQRAVEQLELGQAKFLGAVLNRVDLQHNGYYYSKYYRPAYGSYYGTPGGASGGGHLGAAADAVIGGTGAAGSRAARITAAADEFAATRAASTTLTIANANATTSVTSSVDPSTFGQSVTFTATVTGPTRFKTPTGYVQFSDNGADLGTPVPLSPVTGGGAAFALLMTSELTAGSHAIQATYLGDARFEASRSDPITQTVTKARPTVVVDDASVTYDGQPHAATGRVTGGVAGEDLGALNFTYAGSPIAPTDAGTYAVLGSYDGSANYESAGDSATLTITKATPMVVVGATSVTYDGQPHTAMGTVRGVGGVDLGTLSFAYTPGPGAPVNAGVYRMIGSFAGTSNYEAGSDGATLTILKAKPKVVVDDASVTYDGEPHVARGRVMGVVAGEDLGAPNFTYQGSPTLPTNAGTYAVLGSYAASANYEAASDSATLTITKATPTVIVGAASVTYDGQPHTATGTVTGVGGVDLGALSFGYTPGPGAPVNAGVYQVIASFAGASNYDASSDGATLTIRKAKPTVVVHSASVAYDGQPHTGTGTVTGVGGVDLGAPSFAYIPGPEAPVNAGVYQVIGSFAGTSNYDTGSDGATLTIRKAKPTVVVEATSLAYDGRPHTATGTVTGVGGADLGAPSFAYTPGPEAPVNAGVYQVIGSFAGTSNYDSGTSWATLTIRKAKPAVVVDDANLIYDGHPHAARGRVTGGVAGEDLGALSFTYTPGSEAPVNAGVYEVIGSFAATSNYDSGRSGATLTIRKAKPTVVAGDASVTYDGQPHVATGRVTGVVADEDLGALSFTYTPGPGAPVNAGVYQVIGSFAGTSNYDSGTSGATLTINKATPTVVVDDTSAAYDGQPHAARGRVTGVVADEDLRALSFIYTPGPGAPVNAGVYQVIGSFAGTSNYDSGTSGATLTIRKATPTVVVDAASVTYDGQPHTATGTVTGVGGVDLGALRFAYTPGPEAPVDAGVYQVNGSFAGTSNYEAGSDGATLTILKATPTVVIDDASVTDDGQPHAATGSVTGVDDVAFAFENADDPIRNADELKTCLGLPFLGTVPRRFDRAIAAPLVSDGVSNAFSESFRSIGTNVLLSRAGESGRLIVITSSMPGEGKTVVATNLAITLAQAGHRVLLIDGDMRKPRVHEVFSLAAEPGLSNVLVGNAAAAEAIRASSTPGLWVMPAGTSPPNPVELLGSTRFKDSTASLLQHFDWVIVDMPPVITVTDASIAASLAHGVLFVVGAESTSRRVAQRAVEQLELARAKFLGGVLNQGHVPPIALPGDPSATDLGNGLESTADSTGVDHVAVAPEHADDGIRNPDVLTTQLGMPCLGMVPRLGDTTIAALLVGHGVSNAFSESFRSIRTNVLFSSAGEEGGRLIVITSSAANEGKTLVSTNLAVTLAQAGHRVLLIDADMRNPRVHEVFSHPLTPGLSNLLVGDAVASAGIHGSSTPGLWVMPAGTSPPNPAALLGLKRFKDFTAFLQQQFDWVIVDTPPVMTATDASIAANLSHGVLFVVDAEMTSARFAQYAVEQLKLGQVKFLGAVLNRVDLREAPTTHEVLPT